MNQRTRSQLKNEKRNDFEKENTENPKDIIIQSNIKNNIMKSKSNINKIAIDAKRNKQLHRKNISDSFSDEKSENSMEEETKSNIDNSYNHFDHDLSSITSESQKLNRYKYKQFHDYWKIPKKVIKLNDKELNEMKKIKEYYDNVIDKHELTIK